MQHIIYCQSEPPHFVHCVPFRQKNIEMFNFRYRNTISIEKFTHKSVLIPKTLFLFVFCEYFISLQQKLQLNSFASDLNIGRYISKYILNSPCLPCQFTVAKMPSYLKLVSLKLRHFI